MQNEEEVFLPVIDGPEPAKWELWETCFAEVRDKFMKIPRRIPSPYKHLPSYCLRPLLYSPQILFSREDDAWIRVVGVILDGRAATVMEERANIEDNYRQLLAKLCLPVDPWYKKLGFFLVVIVDQDADRAVPQAQTDFYYSLRSEAAQLLGDTLIKGQYIPDESSLLNALSFFNSGLTFNKRMSGDS